MTQLGMVFSSFKVYVWKAALILFFYLFLFINKEWIVTRYFEKTKTGYSVFLVSTTEFDKT